MNDNQGTLLIVDDEGSIRHSLRTILSSLGFQIVEAARGEEALALVRTAHIDAVLLDIDMPGIGGIGACRGIRRALPAMPILMLTVHGSEDHKLEAFDAGADDYITKPFQLRELTARIRAVLRRMRPVEEAEPVIVVGDIALSPARHEVTKKGRKIHLTPMQFELLQYLMEHAGGAISHGRLLRAVWGPEYGSELEYLRTFIRQLRLKIEDDPGNPKYLLTDSHFGYRFEEPGQTIANDETAAG
jgi:two-component system, OmpR family, KDP operon response regulator KdpE